MALQLLMAVVLPAALLIGLTWLLSSGLLSFSRPAAWLLARRNTIWMSGIIALTAAAAIYAFSR
ncbi:MAG: hypothetical protein CMN95_08055 [Synechococcus sp. MED650]|nr:hypothetical protein [Synechococcus sp. MED650]OUW53578.1 MAG: hypothetical protein CBD48_06225 [Cyanobacteria bacterium TMED188]